MDKERADYADQPGQARDWPPPLRALGLIVPWALIVAGTVFHVVRELVAALGI
jgi:hypothetical protein